MAKYVFCYNPSLPEPILTPTGIMLDLSKTVVYANSEPKRTLWV